MLVLLSLIIYVNVCESRWEIMTDKEDIKATWYILNLTSEIIHDTDERIAKIEFHRQGSLRSAPYEIGYLMYQIQEEYRRMLDIYNTSFTMQRHFYPMEQVLFLHDIESHYWAIEHLCNMQHEVERKYRIFTDPNDDYEEPEVTKKPKFVLPDLKKTEPGKPKPHNPFQHIKKEKTTKKRKGPKKSKDEKYLEQMLDRIHTTKKKSTRWWWPLEYGWEIDEYW